MLSQVNILFAQDNLNVQIKVFDLQLNPVPNLELVIDELEPTKIGNNGIGFKSIINTSLPPSKIEILNSKLEAESWNYSKGTLEIIVRENKSRQVIIKVLNKGDETPLSNVKLHAKSLPDEQLITNSAGIISLDIPNATSIITPEFFTIDGYNISAQTFNEEGGVLLAEKLISENIIDQTAQVDDISPPEKNEMRQVIKKQELKYELGLDQIDSIKSLTVFFALMKKLDFDEIDTLRKKKIDDKFYELSRLNTLSSVLSTSAIELINDSSIVNDDLLVLIEKIEYEAELLGMFRDEFESAASQIKLKLADGGINLSIDERQVVIQLIMNLKELLRRNEEQFYINNAYYKTEINNLHAQLSDILELEDQLIESEESKRKYKEQLIYTSLTLSALIGLVLLLVFLIRIFSSQRKELQSANDEIEKINNNLEGLVEEKTASLEKINYELDTFLYRSSHNLRRPITSIQGLANVAAISLDEEGISLFEKVTKTSGEMELMIDKLGMMNFINQPTDFGLINFEEIYDKVKSKYAQQIEKSDIEIDCNCQKDLNFKSYPLVVEIIIRNLFENAVLFSRFTTSDQPQIKITVKKARSNNDIYVSIHDNGCGIDKEIRNKIWEMFFIGNVASEGNGLGLYITKKAVESLNATISLKTKSMAYCQFDVVFPYDISSDN